MQSKHRMNRICRKYKKQKIDNKLTWKSIISLIKLIDKVILSKLIKNLFLILIPLVKTSKEFKKKEKNKKVH